MTDYDPRFLRLEEEMITASDDTILPGPFDSSAAKTLILPVGLPCSGKSTWARSQGVPIVSPDEIRFNLHGQAFATGAERFVWAIAHVMVESLFSAGASVIILDACNVSPERRDEWIDPRWELAFRCFDTPVETCKGRAIASGQENLLPIIDRMATRLVMPTENLIDSF